MTVLAKPGRHWPGFFFLMLVACLASAATVQAQVQASSDYLARMDADHDGRVSLSEYQDWLCYAFDAMDRNHDGVLVAAELPGGRGASTTREQHRARLADAFRRQDRDGDGVLDARELATPPR
jgi:Ca2+-binding EF-hand superfamily protein